MRKADRGTRNSGVAWKSRQRSALMKTFELMIEGCHTLLTAEQIAESFQDGRTRRADPCRQAGAAAWRTVDELFPLLKYDSSDRVIAAAPIRRDSVLDRPNDSGNFVRPLTSALKAGWICFGIGLLLAWFFPLANVFFSIAIITAIVAMCTHQVNRGLALLLSSLFAIALCTLIFFTLVFGTVGVATKAAIKKTQSEMKQLQARQVQNLNAAGNQLGSSIGPSKRVTSANALSTSIPADLKGTLSDRQRQYELAIAQQREADARRAADQRLREGNVREAERQRDQTKAKEERLRQVQNSIDSNDRIIRRMREQNVNPKIWEEKRDSLLREKAKMQGY